MKRLLCLHNAGMCYSMRSFEAPFDLEQTASPRRFTSKRMYPWDKPVRIIDVDLVKGGLIVTFSDGRATLYQTQFLYDSWNEDGNMQILKPRAQK